MANIMSPGGVRSQRYGSMGGQSFGYAQASINSDALTGGPGSMGLPLAIVSQIIRHLDNLDDVARFLRTSRLHYYMTLPRLYEKVRLRSYSDIRRVNGRVEGLGGSSPFCMAVGALATSQAATVVKDLILEGDWNEGDEYMLGRIPDITMLLCVSVRAALDRLEALKSFTWKLETKPVRIVYQGLSVRSTLTRFEIDFPTTRTPRPIARIPPIPSLRALKVTNLDPLCYNDDISDLLFGSKKLEELTMHWNPRMRLEAECSANLTTYFSKCIQAGYMIGLKKVGFQNYYGPNHGQFVAVLPQQSITNSHFLDMFGGAHGRRTNVFVDETWRTIPPVLNFKWKLHRSNELAMQHTRILRGFKGLEELYLISKTIGVPTSPHFVTTPPSASPGSPKSVSSATSSAGNTPGYLPGADLVNLGNEYLDAILGQHGPTLRNLLLFNKFGFLKSQITNIAESCPNLRELGLGVAGDEDVFRDMIPQFPNLRALRILENEFLYDNVLGIEEHVQTLCRELGRQIYRSGNKKLGWIGIGERVFEVGREPTWEEGEEARLELVEVDGQDDVQHIGIWGYDNLVL